MARAMMLVASNTTDPERVADYHDWYAAHVRELLEVDGLVAATRWAVSPHTLIPGLDAIDGRRFVALYEIECDDLEAVRDRIVETSPQRSHSDLLEMDPPPLTVLLEPLGEWKQDEA